MSSVQSNGGLDAQEASQASFEQASVTELKDGIGEDQTAVADVNSAPSQPSVKAKLLKRLRK